MSPYARVVATVLAAGLSAEVRAALPYTVVDTSQVKTYNNSGEIPAPAAGQAFYGQDAQFLGVQASYTVSADAKTVLDNNTALTWMRGPNTTLAPPVKADKMTFVAAQAWFATLNASNYGGSSDWRLPTIKELYSIFDCRGTDPSGYMGSDTSVLTPFIDPTYFNFAWGQTSLGERLIDSQYASSTTFILNPSESGYRKIFGVNFADGRIKGYDEFDSLNPSHPAKTFFVQLVRGNASYGRNDFADNGDQTGLLTFYGVPDAPLLRVTRQGTDVVLDFAF